MSEDDSSSTEEETTESNSERKTVLYAFTRKALRKEDLVNIKDALEDEGYFMEYGEDSGNILIQRDESTDEGVDIQEVLGN